MPTLRLLLAAALLAPNLLAGGEAAPDQTGPWQLASASLLGGEGREAIAGIGIQSDLTVIAAGSCDAAFSVPGLRSPPSGSGGGFVTRLDPAGKVLSLAFLPSPVAALAIGPKDRIYLRGEDGGITILEADATRSVATIAAGKGDRQTLAVDGDGSVLAVVGSTLTRFDASGKQVWAMTPPAHGRNRPRACAVDPKTGIAVVVGYGMTGTGKEPWKDPYAHAYDRAGKLLWSLWNNPPGDQKGAKFGGNGLMADGTGDAAAITPDGKFLVSVFHDGGNAVTTRDPHDASQKLDPAVFAGSFQNNPGYGMKGAITTSVCFRVDPATGKLEKGTWMCAWMDDHHRANSLHMENVAGGDHGEIFIVGSSAWELPVLHPWYAFRDGEYHGGGFLAVFGSDFAMQQCGPWNPGDITCVAVRGDIVAIAGKADGTAKNGPIAPAEQMRLFKHQGQDAVSGPRDAFVAILHRAGAAIPTSGSANRKQPERDASPAGGQ